MTMLNIGILAVVAAFNSGAIALRNASEVSAASVLGDKQMELYRALKYTEIALDTTAVGTANGDTIYQCDVANKVNPAGSCGGANQQTQQLKTCGTMTPQVPPARPSTARTSVPTGSTPASSHNLADRSTREARHDRRPSRLGPAPTRPRVVLVRPVQRPVTRLRGRTQLITSRGAALSRWRAGSSVHRLVRVLLAHRGDREARVFGGRHGHRHLHGSTAGAAR